MRVFYLITPVGTDSDLIEKIFTTVGTVMGINPMIGITNSDTLKICGVLQLPSPYNYDNYILDNKGFNYSIEPNNIYYGENRYIMPIIAPHDIAVITSGSFDMYREMVRWKDKLSDIIEIYPIVVEQPPNKRFNYFMAYYDDVEHMDINSFHKMMTKFQKLDNVFSVFDNNPELVFKFDDCQNTAETSAMVMHLIDYIYTIKNGCETVDFIDMHDKLEEKVLNS